MYRRVAATKLKDGDRYLETPGGITWEVKGYRPRARSEVLLVPPDHDPLDLYAMLDAFCTRHGKPSVEKRFTDNAWFHRHGDAIALRLHDTSILMCWPGGNVMLSTGGHGGNTGWPTITTARYLDAFLPRGWGVTRTKTRWSDKTWCVWSPNVEFIFREGMILNLYTEEEVSPGLEMPVVSWPKGYHREPGYHHYG